MIDENGICDNCGKNFCFCLPWLGPKPSPKEMEEMLLCGYVYVPYVPPGMTKEELTKISKDAFRRFYFRPKIILGFLPLLLNVRGLKLLWIGLGVLLKTIFRKGK